MSEKRQLAILIPAYNERALIGRCITSVLNAGIPVEDVYVVDDGSRDGTDGVVHALGPVALLTTRNGGKARAIRHGLSEFKLSQRYDWIGILDADSALDPGYLEAVEGAVKRFPDAALICGSPQSDPHNWLTAYRAVEYAICLGIYREAQSLTGTINVAPGCASVYRADVLAQLDLDGGTLVEDMDLTIQLQRLGKRIVYVPDMKVHTQDPRTLSDYIGQVNRWYRGLWQVIRRHRLMRRRQLIDVECALLVGEGLGFSILVLMLPVWIWLSPRVTVVLGATDQALFFAMTALVAVREGRLDILRSYPRYIIPRLINAVLFVWTFFAERRGGTKTWFTVARYEVQ